MTVMDLRRTDPMRLDQLVKRSAWAARRSADTGAAYAAAFGLSSTRGKRARLGDVSSPAAKNMLTIYNLARGNGTTARAQIAEEMNVLRRLEIENKTNDELRALHVELNNREHFAEARESLHTADLNVDACTAEQLEEAAEADNEEAELQWWRGEVRRAIAERMRTGTWGRSN
jgi:hypothetical protein